jgi:hypothetical protein
MTPRTEFNDLIARSRALLDAVLLVLITFALLIVSAGVLFCSIWITVFRTGRMIADRTTARVAIPEMLR